MLFTGQVIPVIEPELRGMFNWTTQALIEAVIGPAPRDDAMKGEHTAKVEVLHNFLDRIYYELRNLGLTPEERAINFAATNAFETQQALETARKKDMELDTIEIERSPICRPDSDCWDLLLIFFTPSDPFRTSREVHRFTVDVSDVVPVTVGPRRTWFIR
jgi:cyanobactin maturation PatA/PatG family protease